MKQKFILLSILLWNFSCGSSPSTQSKDLDLSLDLASNEAKIHFDFLEVERDLNKKHFDSKTDKHSRIEVDMKKDRILIPNGLDSFPSNLDKGLVKDYFFIFSEDHPLNQIMELKFSYFLFSKKNEVILNYSKDRIQKTMNKNIWIISMIDIIKKIPESIISQFSKEHFKHTLIVDLSLADGRTRQLSIIFHFKS